MSFSEILALGKLTTFALSQARIAMNEVPEFGQLLIPIHNKRNMHWWNKIGHRDQLLGISDVIDSSPINQSVPHLLADAEAVGYQTSGSETLQPNHPLAPKVDYNTLHKF
jgi:hypothetical protein